MTGKDVFMIQTTVKVSGMACSMCEAHINDAVRGAFPVEKVTSSHSKGETVILSQEPPSGGFSRVIWLEHANQLTFKGGESKCLKKY